jgi:uncharacterized membrane protein
VSRFMLSKLPLAALLGWCLAMFAVRALYSASLVNGFLIWNLVLAVVPAAASGAFAFLDGRPHPMILDAALLGVWLLFLPNAPYLVTDLVHLTHIAPVPIWYDVALFGSFAATGALLGFASVAEVESVLRRRIGAMTALGVSAAALLASGFGIYLGRFLRLNSWDALSSPSWVGRQVVHQVAHPVTRPQSWEVAMVYGFGMLLGYLALRAVAPLLAPPQGDRRSRSADAG